MSRVSVEGTFHCRLYDRRRRLVRKWAVSNAAVYEGINFVLAAAFQGGSQVSPWKIGLISGGSAPTLSAADTMLSHPGWTELTAYSEAVRQSWDGGTPSSGAISSSSPAVFTINADTTSRGMFLCTDDAKGGTAGALWATAAGGNRTLLNGQTLEVSYTNRITPIS